MPNRCHPYAALYAAAKRGRHFDDHDNPCGSLFTREAVAKRPLLGRERARGRRKRWWLEGRVWCSTSVARVQRKVADGERES